MWKLICALLLWLIAAPSFAWVHGFGGTLGQVNLNVGESYQVGTALEYPFRNFMKLWQPNYDDISALEVNGYPKSGTLTTSILGQLTNIPVSQTGTGTQWVLKWSGKMGTNSTYGFQFLTGTNIISDIGGCIVGDTTNNTNFGGTNCRVVFNFTGNPTGLTMDFQAGGVFDGTASNLVLCRLSDEAGLDAAVAAGDASGGFNPDFIAKTKTTPYYPAILRTTNWETLGPNLTANVSDQTPVAAVTYGVWWNIAKYAGIASGTNAYSITYNGGTLIEGLAAHVRFTNASTSTVTLSIDGGTTFKPMLDLNGGAIQTNAISANSTWTVVYDSLLQGWISQNGTASDSIPLALQISLANTVGTNLWYNIPTHATDAFVTSIATTIKNTLNRTAIYEFSLEVWNFGGGFAQTFWAGRRGAALGFPDTGLGIDQQIFDYYGLRVRQITGLINTVYGGAANCGPTKSCTVILASQGGANTASANQPNRLNGVDLNGATYPTYCAYVGGSWSGGVCTGDPGYNTFPNRPIDVVDGLSWADYYTGAQLQQVEQQYTGTEGNKVVSSASNANPLQLTVTAHGYSTGQRVQLNDFTGTGWSGLNGQNVNVTVVNANTITVPINATGFAAYSSNAGNVYRYAIEMTALTAAADAWALGNFASGISLLDATIQSGTNYGVADQGNTLLGLDTYFNTPWETVAASYDGARPSGKSNLITALYEGGFQALPPLLSATCTTLGISTSYCGASGSIANLLGYSIGVTPSPNSYKMSAAFQATVKLQFDQYMAHAHSKYPSWLSDFGGGQWSEGTGDIYQSMWSSYTAIQNYHYP